MARRRTSNDRLTPWKRCCRWDCRRQKDRRRTKRHGTHGIAAIGGIAVAHGIAAPYKVAAPHGIASTHGTVRTHGVARIAAISRWSTGRDLEADMWPVWGQLGVQLSIWADSLERRAMGGGSESLEPMNGRALGCIPGR